jgi:hypothetical protein
MIAATTWWRKIRYVLGGVFLLSALALLAVRLWHPGYEFEIPKTELLRTRRGDRVAYIQDLTQLAPRGSGFSLETELWRLALRSSSGGRFSLREDGKELRPDSGLLYESAGPAEPGRVHRQSRRLFFTASDGGDPRSGAGRYSLRAYLPIHGWLILQIALAGLLLCLPAALYRFVWRFCASPPFIRFFQRIRYALSVLFLLSAPALLAVRLWHPGWELELPKSGLIKVRADKVYFVDDIMALAPGREGASLDDALLRYSLRSAPNYSLREDGRELSFERDLFHENENWAGKGLVEIVFGRLYFAPSDDSDPRTNASRYFLRVFPPIRAKHLLLLALAGLILLAPASYFVSAWRSCLTAGQPAFLEIRDLGLEARRWAPGFVAKTLKREVWICGVLVAAAAFIYILLSPEDLLAEIIGWLDTYVYIGYGLSYPSPDFMPGYYKISRLPWVYFLTFLWRVFRPELATPILASLTIMGQGVLAYLLAWRLTRHLPAAVVAGLYVGLFPFWHHVDGWNYHAHPGGMLFWLTICLLPVNRNKCTAKRYLPAFAVFALALHVNPTLLSLVPAGLVWCLLPIFTDAATWRTVRERKTAIFKTLIAAAVYAALAFVVVTALLCLSFRITYGDWLFFLPNIRTALVLAMGDPWFNPFGLYWLESGRIYITVIALSLLLSLIMLLRDANNGGDKIISPRIASLSYICAAAAFLFAHLNESELLGFAHQAYGLQCFSLVPLSLFIAWICPEYGKSKKLAFGICLAVIFFILALFALDLRFSLSNWIKYPLIPCGLLVMAATALKLTFPFRHAMLRLAVVGLLFLTIAGYSRAGLSKESVHAPLFRIMLRQYGKIQNLVSGEPHPEALRGPIKKHYRLAVLKNDAIGGTPLKRYCLSFMEVLGIPVIHARTQGHACELDSLPLDDLEVASGLRIILFGGGPEIKDRAEDILETAGLHPELKYSDVEFDSGYAVHMWVFAVSRDG